MAMRGGSWLGVVAALCAAGMPSRGAVLVVTPGLLLLGKRPLGLAPPGSCASTLISTLSSRLGPFLCLNLQLALHDFRFGLSEISCHFFPLFSVLGFCVPFGDWHASCLDVLFD